MLHPSTTSELLLQQAVDLLTEVRDLLRSGQAPASPPPNAPPAGAPPVARPAASPTTRRRRTAPRQGG